MKVSCPAFENHESWSVRKAANHLWMKIASNLKNADETYVTSSSRDLIPVHLVNDKYHNESFTIHKGLILFHFAIHPEYDTDGKYQDWKYPLPGTFFATSPSHSLNIAFNEKRDVILGGLRRLPLDPLTGDMLISEEEYEILKESLRLPGEVDGLDELGHYDMHPNLYYRLLEEEIPARGRLLIYQLKRDLRVIDSPGDSISCAEFLKKYPNLDGVVGGYSEGDDYRTGMKRIINLNEVRICTENVENYLDLIEEIDISKDMVRENIIRYTDSNFLTTTKVFETTILMPERIKYSWSMITEDLGLLYLWAYLENKIGIEFRLKLFIGSQIYVNGSDRDHPIGIIIIFPWFSGNMLAFCWYERNVRDIWPLLKIFTSALDLVKSDEELRQMTDTDTTAKLIIEDRVMQDIINERLLNPQTQATM